MLRRETSRIVPVVIATGTGGLAILRNIAPLMKELPYIMLLHTSKEEVMSVYEAIEAVTPTKAGRVLPHVLGMKWDGRWIPLTEDAGRGAGKDLRKGRRLFDVGKDVLREDLRLLAETMEMDVGRPTIAFFINSLGGGTGSALVDLDALIREEMGCSVFNIYTFPNMMEPSDSWLRAIDALKGITNTDKSATLIDYNHLLEGMTNTTLGAIYSEAARRAGNILASFFELFINPSNVIMRADTEDLLESARPPFGFITSTLLTIQDNEYIRKNATAWPTSHGRFGKIKMFTGFMTDPDLLATSVRDKIASLFGVNVNFTHIVDLGRNEAILVLGSFTLDELVQLPWASR
ncbi:MAG: hypothetical protein QXR62_03620 [Candidatus Bathyarchaeia archaeon]